MLIFFAIFIASFLIIAIGIFVGINASILKRKIFFENLETGLFLVRIPRKSKDGLQVRSEINISEALFSALAASRRPFILEVAVPHIGEEINFYVAVPKNLSEAMARQVQGLWPDAQVEPAQDYNIFNPAGEARGAFLKLKENFALPIRSYTEIDSDTFSPVLSGFTKINEIGEGASIQILVKPAMPFVKKNINNAITSLKKGIKLSEVLGVRAPLMITPKDIYVALSPSELEKQKKEEQMLTDEEAIKAITTKVAKPLFDINIRIITSAATGTQAENILNGISTAFSQFGSPNRNGFNLIAPSDFKKFIYQYSFREFADDQSVILNSEELASVFHFPTPFTDIPRIKWLKFKEAPPPANLPTAGVLIGESAYRGDIKPIYISNEDRRRHAYIIGQTGTGKSTLITNMVIDDIQKGKGVAVIDPHGDLIETILGAIPRERQDDVVIFDPGDINNPVGLNMLEYDFNRPEEKTFIVNEMLNIFDKLYDMKSSGGPMFEQYMRNALQLLMEDMPNEPATLTEVPRVFSDAEFRKRKLARIRNPIVIDFWEKEAAKAGGDAALANITPYITSKFNVFLANDYVRPIVGQPKSAFNFRQIIEDKKILLVNLSKGKIGDTNASLLGMIFTGKILMSAFARADMPKELRHDFNLYIDEFQNFTTDSISVILSEARKYGLTLTMAHQFIAQLTDRIRDAVFGNVGSKIVFRVGTADAEFLAKEFEPIFSQNDLANIDNFNACVKLLVNNETTKPFNIKTVYAPHEASQEVIDNIKNTSRARYGQSRFEVEEEIYRRSRE